MIIFHPWSLAREAEQQETWAALDQLRDLDYDVFDFLCTGPDDYQKNLFKVWGKGHDILIVEQDIVPDPGMVYAMAACPEYCCAQAYKIHPVSSGLSESVYVHRVYVENRATRWIQDGEDRADLVGLGMTKISREVQEGIGPEAVMPGRWDNLDVRLSQAINQGTRFHIHWPECRHNHK